MGKYLIKLNVGGTVYNLSAPTEQAAWQQVLRHETFYNPNWGYTLLNNKLEELNNGWSSNARCRRD